MALSVFIDVLHVVFIVVNIALAFSSTPLTLLLSIMINLSLLTHWLTNNDTCALTLMEAMVSGRECNQTFMHRLVSPVYKFDHSTVYHATYALTVLLIIIASYRLGRLLSTKKNDPENSLA